MEKITRVKRKTFVIACRVLLKVVVQAIPHTLCHALSFHLVLFLRLKVLLGSFGGVKEAIVERFIRSTRLIFVNQKLLLEWVSRI